MYQNWNQKHFGLEQKDNFWSKAITTLWGSHWKRVTLQWRTEVNYILYCGCSSRYLTFEWQLWFEHIVKCRRCWQHNHNHDSHQILPQIILWIQSNKHCLHLKGFSPEWMRRCLFRLPSVVQEYLHCVQLKGFSPLWISLWVFKLLAFVLEKLHWLQLCFFFRSARSLFRSSLISNACFPIFWLCQYCTKLL